MVLTILWAAQIEVNQDYAGHSGSQFAQSDETVTLHGCDWKAGVSCDWPKWTAWYKPLSGRDGRQSTVAVLLMNNDYEPARLSFAFAEIPGMDAHDISTCEVYDVWARKSLGVVTGPRYTTEGLSLSLSLALSLALSLLTLVSVGHRSRGFTRLKVPNPGGVQMILWSARAIKRRGFGRAGAMH